MVLLGFQVPQQCGAKDVSYTVTHPLPASAPEFHHMLKYILKHPGMKPSQRDVFENILLILLSQEPSFFHQQIWIKKNCAQYLSACKNSFCFALISVEVKFSHQRMWPPCPVHENRNCPRARWEDMCCPKIFKMRLDAIKCNKCTGMHQSLQMGYFDNYCASVLKFPLQGHLQVQLWTTSKSLHRSPVFVHLLETSN